MRRYGLAGALGGMLTLAAGLVQADNSKADNRLEERVEDRLKNQGKFNGLDADVDNGVVTLKGEVATTADKTRAARLARNAGARKVVNNLEIDPDKTAARIEERAEARKDAIDERAERQKDAIDRQAEVAKDRVENGKVVVTERRPARVTTAHDRDNNVVDPWITTKVKTKILADDMLDRSEINVDTDKDGVVTLHGWVPTATAEARALDIARTTDGVRKVVDKLDVREPSARVVVDRHDKVIDPLVTAKVKTKIMNEDMLDKSEINVDTDNDGVVTLKGHVHSPSQKSRALELARTTDGVRKVVDKLDVKAPVVK